MRSCPTCGSEWTLGEAFCPFDGARLVETPSLLPAPPDPWLGKVLDGRYRLESLLGSGGMGYVYRARHEKLGNEVAIKILRDSEAANDETVERFRREAQSASFIGHPGIVRVIDFGVAAGGAHYMVMELLDGEDVSRRLSTAGPFPVQSAVKLLLEACEALEAAHRAGIVHRDLKPENLFLARLPEGGERLKVVDFGLAKMSDVERPGVRGAKLTKTGTVFGTPKYMPPEQALGKGADARSDVYSLGCIAYEMLTGVAPFDAENYLGIVNQHLFDPPPPFATANPSLSIPYALEAVIMQALAKKPEERIQSMESFALEIARAAGIELRPSLVAHSVTLPDVSSRGSTSARPGPRSVAPAVPSVRPSSRPLRIDESDELGNAKLPSKRSSWLVPVVLVLVATAAVSVYLLVGAG